MKSLTMKSFINYVHLVTSYSRIEDMLTGI